MDRNKNILIAEDDKIISMDLKKSLSELGYNVYEPVTSGIEIVNMALALKPDVILMDIKLMGNVDGIDAAKTIKLNKNIPVIFITAYESIKANKKVKHVSEFKIIQKPYSIEAIDKAIIEALHLNGKN